jgi:hypothetical protein
MKTSYRNDERLVVFLSTKKLSLLLTQFKFKLGNRLHKIYNSRRFKKTYKDELISLPKQRFQLISCKKCNKTGFANYSKRLSCLKCEIKQAKLPDYRSTKPWGSWAHKTIY